MDTDTAVIVYESEDGPGRFEWHGGAYVEVGYVDSDDVFHAGDVIDVWDAAKDRSRYELAAEGSPRPFRHILELFEADCQAYLERAYAEAGAEE